MSRFQGANHFCPRRVDGANGANHLLTLRFTSHIFTEAVQNRCHDA